MATATADVIVVGARVAGAATARLLARQGLDVLVVDRDRPGTDTLSTHALMRGAVVQLQRWGLIDRLVAAGTPPVEHVTFHYGDRIDPVDLRGRAGPLYAPRRTVLDPLLVDAAREAGARFRFGVKVDGLVHGPDGRVAGVRTRTTDGTTETLLARHVVGADGRRSRVAAAVDAPVQHQARGSGACVYRLVEHLPTQGYEWFYRPGRAAGLIPTNGRRTVVWSGAPTARFLAERRAGLPNWWATVLAEAAPEVAEVVQWLPRGRTWGFAGVPTRVLRPWGPGWVLVGDAGAFRDPISSHGITDALRDAELAARAIVASHAAPATELVNLRRFHALRDRSLLPVVAATDAVARYDWDLPELERRLRQLSDAMRQETAFLRQLDAAADLAA
ncbi:NAD(P)/FAD-dependent oxidoreductase [Egicoccus sp. AB-alg2]|uniref:NAD(P)/FAD-dependent oxidoreductase n=1 Tax=Egicoccus sp. AB-alg2 TaxID=3242693 RepID=UPI00359E2C20